jgi:hypothetical protein
MIWCEWKEVYRKGNVSFENGSPVSGGATGDFTFRCEEPASRKVNGRWLCEWHADVVEDIDSPDDLPEPRYSVSCP